VSCDYFAAAKLLVIVLDRLFHQAFVGFRRFCVESENLPADLHIVMSDILQEAGLLVQTKYRSLCNTGMARVSMHLCCFAL